jgi:hypothetical protein
LTQGCKTINDTVRYDLDKKISEGQDCNQLKNDGEGRGDRGPPPNLKQDRGLMKARIGGAHAPAAAAVWIERTHRRRKTMGRNDSVSEGHDCDQLKNGGGGRGSRDPPPNLSENRRSSRVGCSNILDQESSSSEEERTERNERK